MNERSNFSGIFANEKSSEDAGISFGKHFSKRSPKIDEVLPRKESPQQKSNQSGKL